METGRPDHNPAGQKKIEQKKGRDDNTQRDTTEQKVFTPEVRTQQNRRKGTEENKCLTLPLVGLEP